jgi:hypothetical protein
VGASTARTDADPRNLFEAVVQVLHYLAAERPLVATFEDLHWADEMSLRLLAFAGRRLTAVRTLLIATARDEDLSLAPVLGQTLGELERDQRLTRRRLAPLSRVDTVADLAPGGEGPRVGGLAAIEEQVWRERGESFVAVETVRAPATSAIPADRGTLLPVAFTIAQRLARLGEPSLAVRRRRCSRVGRQRLRAAPARGRPARADAARAVEGWCATACSTSRATGSSSHDRIREVAHADLLVPHRLVLHRRIAEFEALHAGLRAADALAPSTHYRAAEVKAPAT